MFNTECEDGCIGAVSSSVVVKNEHTMPEIASRLYRHWRAKGNKLCVSVLSACRIEMPSSHMRVPLHACVTAPHLLISLCVCAQFTAHLKYLDSDMMFVTLSLISTTMDIKLSHQDVIEVKTFSFNSSALPKIAATECGHSKGLAEEGNSAFDDIRELQASGG